MIISPQLKATNEVCIFLFIIVETIIGDKNSFLSRFCKQKFFVKLNLDPLPTLAMLDWQTVE